MDNHSPNKHLVPEVHHQNGPLSAQTSHNKSKAEAAPAVTVEKCENEAVANKHQQQTGKENHGVIPRATALGALKQQEVDRREGAWVKE